MFPTVYPVQADTVCSIPNLMLSSLTDFCLQMNYAVVILAFIFLCAGVYWLISGRKFYIGPLSETTVLDGHQPEKDRETEKEVESDEVVR